MHITLKDSATKLDKEDIKVRYDEYNEKYFDGKLGKCKFHFYPKSTRFLGGYSNKTDKKGKITHQIWIGTYVQWTDYNLKLLLLHEMIHLYNHTVEPPFWKGTLGHGRCFRRQVRRLKKEHGIIIGNYDNLTDVNGNNLKSPLWSKIITFLLDW